MDTETKLNILSADSQYDLACACGSNDADRRKRSVEDKWIYPVSLPNRPKTFLFKTLVSNQCSNDCRYCPLRAARDPRRCSLGVNETADVFFDYLRKRRVSGLFLSSGVTGTADRTMEQINGIARTVRKQGFKGFMHLKVIPGASDAAIEDTLSLATTVSLNIEAPGQVHFERLSQRKDFMRHIIEPVKLISRLTEKGGRFEGVKQTTQFVVGASDESDWEIVRYMWGLYKRLGLQRVYFSAYQRGLGDPALPGEQSSVSNADILMREHRLYQTDFLIRKYGFDEKDIPVNADGFLSLEIDPKEAYAGLHPECFPLDVNRADYFELLRVPGLGPVSVKRIMQLRKAGSRIRRIEEIGRPGKLLAKAGRYLRFG